MRNNNVFLHLLSFCISLGCTTSVFADTTPKEANNQVEHQSIPQVYQERGQETQVRGKVIDENGLPLMGVHVQTLGDVRSGVITDADGKFSLSLPADKTKRVVELSFIGMATERVIVD